MIQTLVARERLVRMHPGVFALGHARLGAHGRWMAAVLACRPSAMLSYLDAAALHDLRRIGSGQIHVTATGRHRLSGVRCHLARRIDRRDCARVDEMPVTSLPRTYLDIAEILTPSRLIDALEAGERQDKLDVRAIEGVIARSPGRRGIPPLRAALEELTDAPPLLQSGLERAFRHLLRAYHLPEPQFNVYVEGELVDVVWPGHRLVAEVDGFRWHRGKRAFGTDRALDRKLVRAQWRVVRFTDDQLAADPAGVAAELSELLSAGPWPPPAR